MMQQRDNPVTDPALYTVTNPYNFVASAGNRVFQARQTLNVLVTADEALRLKQTGWQPNLIEDSRVNRQLGLLDGSVGVDPNAGPINYGLGTIRYGTTTNSLNRTMDANVRVQLDFAADPAQTQDYINPPFIGWQFWDGSKINFRSSDMGSYFFLLVNLLVRSQVANGEVLADLDVGSTLGPTGTDTEDIFGAAGNSQRLTFKLYITTGTLSLANGVKIFLTPSVPIILQNAAIIVHPLSIFKPRSAS